MGFHFSMGNRANFRLQIDPSYTPPPAPVVYTYRFLEYIGSSGTQYVLTDIVPTYTDKAEITALFGDQDGSNLNYGSLFGYRGSTVGGFGIRFEGPRQDDPYENICFFCGFDAYVGIIYDYVMNHHKVNSYNDAPGTGFLQRGTCRWDNDTITPDQSINVPAPTLGMLIFAGWRDASGGGGEIHPFKRRNWMHVYRFKLYDSSSTVINDLVPAERQPDGVLGLYDTVTGKFYTNAGTGTFVKGNYVD